MFKNYFIITPCFYSIGNAAEEIFWGIHKANTIGKLPFIITPYKFTQILNYRICNEEIFDLNFKNNNVNKYEYLFINLIFNLKFIFLRSYRLIFKKILKKYNLNTDFPQDGLNVFVPMVSDKKLLEKNIIMKNVHKKLNIELKSIKNYNCKIKLEKHKPDLLGEKFVCLHVREGGFKNDQNRRPYRNADINNYNDAIKYLIKKGIYVVRLGDITMKKNDFQDPMYWEYCHSKIKSDLMDLYLIKNSEFYIGMQSGPQDVAMLFDKPTLTLNCYEWFYNYPLKYFDRSLIKNIKNKNGNYLNYEELLELGYDATNISAEYDENHYLVFEENDRIQILKAVKQYFYYYQSKFTKEMTNDMIRRLDKYKSFSNEIYACNELRDCFHDNRVISRMMHRNCACKGGLYV